MATAAMKMERKPPLITSRAAIWPGVAVSSRWAMINIETPTYYTATKKYELNFPSLEEDLDADIVVIGGGFSGVNTSLELAEKGFKNIVLLEARYLGFGGTGRNGGQIMAGIGHDLDKIRKDVGEEGIKAIFEISDMGADIIQARIDKYDIKADFCHGYGYMGYNHRQAKTLRQWEKEFKSLNSKHEIRYLEGGEVRQIIGSDAYSSALLHMDYRLALNKDLGQGWNANLAYTWNSNRGLLDNTPSNNDANATRNVGKKLFSFALSKTF